MSGERLVLSPVLGPMHQTLDSSDVFGYLHGNVSATAEGSQPEGPGPNLDPEIFGTASSLLARVSRKRLKIESVTVPDDDDFATAFPSSPRLVTPALNRRREPIMLHEFSISEENLPGRHERGKKEAEDEAKQKRWRVAVEFFKRGIPEPGAESNWYCGMGNSVGLAALKESLKEGQLEDVLSALKSVSEPRGSHWRQLEVPMDFVGRATEEALTTHTGLEGRTHLGWPFLGWWLIRPYSHVLAEDSAESNSVTARLFMSLDEVVKCLTLSTDERRGVEMPPFRQTFEWRPVGAAAIRKRKRKSDNFQLQIQGNRQDPCADQPPHFRDFLLRREQLRSLWWMQQQEKMDQVFDLTLCRVRVDPANPGSPIPPGSIKSTQFRELNWQLELARRAFYKVRGGILGDAPGYGKTATTIGLIDSSFAVPPPAIPVDQAPYFFRASATLVLVPSNLLDQWVGEIQKFTRQASASPACKSGTRDDATLKVLAIRTVSNLKALTVDEICRAAIVICSYRLLYSKVYRARLLELAGTSGVASGACFAETSPQKFPDAAALRGPVDILNLRRNTRRFLETPGSLMWNRQSQDHQGETKQQNQDALRPSELTFPVLEQIWWKRLVLDEFHELEAIGNTAQFESLRSICAHYRWGLTGTPPTRDLSQVATLAKVFHLGQLPPAADNKSNAYQTDLAQEMAQHFLDHFARQNTSEEVEPVPLQEHIITVDQTAEERAIYLQASRDVAENSGSALSDEDRAERLIKLCSHFAAYCGMSTASSDAGSECHRIISTKQEHAKKTWKTVLQRAVQLELLCQSLGSRAATQEEILKDLGADSSEVGVANSPNVPQAPPAQSHGECCDPAPKPEGPQDALKISGDQDAQEPRDIVSARSFSSPPASMAAAAFAEASRMPLVQLQRLAGPRFSGLEVEADPSSRLANARCQMVEAVQAAVSAQRSVEFFKRTLAAARGDASADQRSCSICLEEDLTEDQLSITVCAHVFHTDCLKEVVKHFGTCPVCRHSLEGKNKVTPLTLELAPDTGAAKGSKGRGAPSHEEMAKKAGSKLAALAMHLQSIKSGEKVLVFCQWEDLKKHIAETLETMRVPHLQLSGNIYKRSDILRRFQETTEDAAQVLLLSLEHAASGTNLTAANHVVFVHPMHASSAERAVAYEAQAIARCRRYGQEKTVHCWRFVARGTIEETITATHQRDLWQDHVREDSKRHRANPASHSG